MKIRYKNLEKFADFLQGLGFDHWETFEGLHKLIKRRKRGRPKKITEYYFYFHLFSGPRLRLDSPEAIRWAWSHKVLPRAYFKAEEKAFLAFALPPATLESIPRGGVGINNLKFLRVIPSLKKAPELTEEEVNELSNGEIPFPSWFADSTYDRVVLGWLEDMVKLPVGTLIISALPFAFLMITEWKFRKAKQSLDAFDYLLDELDVDASEWETIKGRGSTEFNLLGFLHRLAPYIMKESLRCIYCGKRILKRSKRERFFCSRSHNIAFNINFQKYAQHYPHLLNRSREEVKKLFRKLGFEEVKKKYPLLVARR